MDLAGLEAPVAPKERRGWLGSGNITLHCISFLLSQKPVLPFSSFYPISTRGVFTEHIPIHPFPEHSGPELLRCSCKISGVGVVIAGTSTEQGT